MKLSEVIVAYKFKYDGDLFERQTLTHHKPIRGIGTGDHFIRCAWIDPVTQKPDGFAWIGCDTEVELFKYDYER